VTFSATVGRAAWSRAAWRVLTLLVISGFLNYFDRSNLSVGATDIQRDLGLNHLQLGMLLSAFFWTYALMQLLGAAGWLVDRYNVCWILAGGFFLWSGATSITGAARWFGVVFALRLLLGMGESVAYPSYSRILVNHYPEYHRGFANAAIDAGTKLGPALGTLLGGLLMARFGWRAFFVVLGASSLVWLVPWLLWMPRGKGVSAREDPAGIPGILSILRQRSAIFSALGLFCSNYYWYFLLTWLPPYLESARHFSKSRMAVFGSLAYFLIAASGVTSGWLSDRLIARGHTPTRVRKAFAGAGLTLASIIVGVPMIRGSNAAMALLMAACLAFGMFTSNLFAITQTLAGPRASGKWTGLQNGFGNLAGVAAPWFTGWIVYRTGHFALAFVAAAAAALGGAVFFVFGIGKIRQVDFS
jgi:MFS family permease